MENITASELAGFGVGTLLLCATIAAPKIDSFISASQRSSLGMCKRCGDLRLIACSTCKGVGSVRAGGPVRFDLLDDIFQSLGGAESDARTTRCTKCRAKGHFPCPDCSASKPRKVSSYQKQIPVQPQLVSFHGSKLEQTGSIRYS